MANLSIKTGTGITAGRVTTAAAARMAAMAVLLMGGILVFSVGFAHSSLIHNAAHDTRHAFAFPCH